MFRRLLVPLDGSHLSEASLPVAIFFGSHAASVRDAAQYN